MRNSKEGILSWQFVNISSGQEIPRTSLRVELNKGGTAKRNLLHAWRNYAKKIRRYNTKIFPVFLAFTDEDVAAQAITFFGDGFETSSSALSFLLYTLATNPDVQDRVREEVESVLKRHGDKLTFDSLQEMTYLDMVLAGMLHAFVGNVTYKTNFGYMLVLTKKDKRLWACGVEGHTYKVFLHI